MRRFVHFMRIAPGSTGAFFCAAVLLVSCDRNAGTPDWATGGEFLSSPDTPQPRSSPSRPDPPHATLASRNSSGGLRFIAYNVENWLTMDRYADGKTLPSRPKPESQKSAALALLARHSPDVVGLCEIGTLADLKEIQSGLSAAGVDLPHLHFESGADPVRRLGFLSRFPITATSTPERSEYRLEGKSYAIQRGILDATIEADGKTYRFLGAHLKSKLESDQADQAEMRVHEARLLRRHVDQVLESNPHAKLVVYGDFNDTRSTTTVRTITGNYQSAGYLTLVPAKDTRGESWTYRWALHDLYSRIDFIAVSASMRPEVDVQQSRVIDDPDWQDASDHRPILVVFK
jgi:endonuclease/exonuclease/phosphatase family metal-dependent hydrolase